MKIKKWMAKGLGVMMMVGCFGLGKAEAKVPREFVVSAYYSPVPGQIDYVTGSYEGDLRLNGGGVRGADGTGVYRGMLAAPKSYEFGTQIFIPGLGVGTVHDRGGAILEYEDYDRIDVWMGVGDEGRIRALAWGKRRVQGIIYGMGSALPDSIYFAEVQVPERTGLVGLSKGDEGERVRDLQEGLVELGYLAEGGVTGVYDMKTTEAVYMLQKEAGIVTSWQDWGAGHFGEKTSVAFDVKLWQGEEKGSSCEGDFCINLALGDEGEEVEKLQKRLKELGYFGAGVTGVYGYETMESVVKFQLGEGVLSSREKWGAGVFGPSTRATLNAMAEIRGVVVEEDGVGEGGRSEIVLVGGGGFFEEDLGRGQMGDEVRKLQSFLKEEGFFEGEVGGYYGEITEEAVREFQVKVGVLGSKQEAGAGVFGPKTRELANKIIEERGSGKVILSGVGKEKVPFRVLVARMAKRTIVPGDEGEEVLNLEEMLVKLEYLKNTPDGYFDNETRLALVRLQLEEGGISSADAPGAGTYGPKTQEIFKRLVG